MEGAHQIKTGNLLSLSEQQLVDCSKQNNGCNGGLMDYAFEYSKKSPLELESEYKYKAKKGHCEYKEAEGKVSAESFHDVTPSRSSPKQLMAAVAKQPVSIAVEADKRVFQLYKSGVLTSHTCGTHLDHGVLAVGYGTEDGEDYFLVKNSWGSSWVIADTLSSELLTYAVSFNKLHTQLKNPPNDNSVIVDQLKYNTNY